MHCDNTLSDEYILLPEADIVFIWKNTVKHKTVPIAIIISTAPIQPITFRALFFFFRL